LDHIVQCGLTNAIETGSKFGMIPLDRAMADLVNTGVVSFDDALAKSSDPEKIRELTGRATGGRGSSRAPVY
jgi:twitching motility protein PilT